jgi:hypothetical protein
MRTEPRRAGVLHGLLAALLLLATSACLWHNYAPQGLHFDDPVCASCHATHGFGAAVAAASWPLEAARADCWSPPQRRAADGRTTPRTWFARAPPVAD